MNKKITLFLASFVLFFASHSVFASPIINEFMYDLDGADIDWVEIYNTGDDIDVTTLKLLINNSTSNHAISANSGSQTLHNGEYGIIVPTSQVSAFTAKYGNSLNIFTSSFSLPNTSGTIEINNGDKNSPISSVTYESGQGAAGDGKSLQLISGSWISATPTLGKINQLSTTGDDEEGDGDETDNDGDEVVETSSSGSSSQTKISSTQKTTSSTKIKAQITTKLLAYTGIPIPFEGKALGKNGEQLFRGKYFWNFGDGDSREVEIINTDKFSHTYFYPGEYTVLLEYYSSTFSENPEAFEKVIIKVVTPTVSISSVGTEQDFFVELFNNNTEDADISKWILVSDFKSFVIPKNTIIEPKKKIIISSRLTNFSVADKNSLKLVTPQGNLVFSYFIPVFVSSGNTNTKKRAPSNSSAYEEINLPIESGDMLSASAISGTDGSGIWEKQYLYLILVFGFIGVSAGLVYFIRKRGKNMNTGDDFDILNS